VVNNVETFCAAARVLLNGPQWFRSLGTQSSPGTKLLSISGDCARPGVYEVEFGVTLLSVLEMAEAPNAYAVLVGGPSGQFVSEKGFGRRLAFDDLATSGAVVVVAVVVVVIAGAVVVVDDVVVVIDVAGRVVVVSAAVVVAVDEVGWIGVVLVVEPVPDDDALQAAPARATVTATTTRRTRGTFVRILSSDVGLLMRGRGYSGASRTASGACYGDVY
jgi:hypothetical protein